MIRVMNGWMNGGVHRGSSSLSGFRGLEWQPRTRNVAARRHHHSRSPVVGVDGTRLRGLLISDTALMSPPQVTRPPPNPRCQTYNWIRILLKQRYTSTKEFLRSVKYSAKRYFHFFRDNKGLQTKFGVLWEMQIIYRYSIVLSKV